MMEGRSNEQCRDRWNDRLDPKINRDEWTEEEDKLLMDTVKELGVGKWKAVSEKMGNGRKDSAVSGLRAPPPATSNIESGDPVQGEIRVFQGEREGNGGR